MKSSPEVIMVFFLFVLFFVSCDKNRNEHYKERDEVILQTLDSALNIATYNGLDSALIEHFDFFPDSLRFWSSAQLNAALLDSPADKYRAISKMLVSKILDSVNFKFEEPYVFKQNRIIEPNGKEINGEKDFFGSINLSDPVLTEEKDLACYYLALNCIPIRSDGCTFSCAVYCKKVNNLWKIDYVVSLMVIE